MNQIDNIMALVDQYAEAQSDYDAAVTYDDYIQQRGAKLASAEKALRAAIEQALTPGEPDKASPSRTRTGRRKDMIYTIVTRNVLPNGLTLLQVNPDCAAQLDPDARDFGWLYIKGADTQWVTLRKLPLEEIEIAYSQAADMAVLQGTKVRAG